MKRLIPLILVLLLIFFGCSSQKKLAMYDDVLITFGKGGGFTGQQVVYTISNDGKVTINDKLTDKTNVVSTLKAKETLQLFEEFNELNIGNIDFDKPGNMYYFIGETNSKNEKKVVWSDTENPPQAILDYYQYLNTIVNK